MWILILTLLYSGGTTGQAIASVPNFTSEASCMAAAKAWVAQTQRDDMPWRVPKALCVKA